MSISDETKDPYKLAGKLLSCGILNTNDTTTMCRFSCACCRVIWDVLSPECRHALDSAEKYARGVVPREEIIDVSLKMWAFLNASGKDGTPEGFAIRAIIGCLRLHDADDDEDYEQHMHSLWEEICWQLDHCRWAKQQPLELFYDAIYKTFESEIVACVSSNKGITF